MIEDPDLAFPAQIVVTPSVLGDALSSIVTQINDDAEKVNRLGMGLIMFVEILQLEAKAREEKD